ncbi:unnamed protein product [Rhizophagus irregularis]|nr:unnamed protein product [Rhizophagus irregularis]
MKVLAKSARETKEHHHAQIAHSINRHVKLYHREKILKIAISGICGTSVSHLEQNRKKRTWKKEKQITWHFKLV